MTERNRSDAEDSGSRHPLAGERDPDEPTLRRRGIDRREFMRRGAAVSLSLGLLPLERARAAVSPETPHIRRYVTLGKTGLRVPDISFGGQKLAKQTELVHYALDRGITHFDTAEGYQDGRSEECLGKALEGRRSKVTITTKHQAKAGESAATQMTALEASLRRLRTDHVDIYLNHAVNGVARVQNPEWHEFVRRAKEQGKIRFAGMSGHGNRLTECLDYVIERDLVDVVLVAYAFAQDPDFFDRLKSKLPDFDQIAPRPELPGILDRAREKGIGVMAMKTLYGARLNDMRPYEGDGVTFAQAAFRWTLSGKHVDGLVVTMKNEGIIDEYLGASGGRSVGPEDVSLLHRYEEMNGTRQCRYGCGECADSCPDGVAISEVLRTRMYAMDYGDVDEARREYACLEEDAAACATCFGTPCARACPHGIPISKLVGETHRLLDADAARR
jgi:predicted aldo/keto reductase-like oxidoreductase